MSELVASGVSLWWLVDEPDDSELSALIERLSLAHGGPVFPPHVTLLGGIDLPEHTVLGRTEALCRALSPVTLVLDDYGHEARWTRWLFRFVRQTPAVMEAGALARSQFGMDKPFTPHLSLLYGEFAPSVAAPLLTGAPPRAHPLRSSTLAVVRTEGTVQNWRELARIAL